MKKINLGRIIKNKNIDRKHLAEVLYPMHKHPVMAIDRVVNGEMLLDSTQIVKLSDYTGIAVEDLFTDSWKSTIKDGTVTLVNGDYVAVINTETWATSISKHGDTEVLRTFFTPGVSLGSYIQKLDYEISKLINNDDTN